MLGSFSEAVAILERMKDDTTDEVILSTLSLVQEKLEQAESDLIEQMHQFYLENKNKPYTPYDERHDLVWVETDDNEIH